MKDYRKLAIVIGIKVILMVYGATAFAQTRSVRLDSLFTMRNKGGMFNGNVLIAENGNIVYQQAFGFANLERKIANTTSSRSDLGSVSKLFTAVAVLQLKEAGRIKLEDLVIKYLPDFPYPNIRIRHLLTHTSGLPDFQIFDPYYTDDPHRILTNKDVIPGIIKFGRLLFEPGEKWSYSSPGMALLASIVEKVSGLAFEKYLTKYIWKPAGMFHTYINSLSAPVKDTNRVENYATSDFFSTSLYLADTMRTHIQFSQISGALLGPGLVASDTRDLFLFDQALYSGTLLSQSTMKEAFTPIKLNNGEYAMPEPWLGQTRFGLGWFILETNPAEKMVLHTGKHAGIVTVFIRNLSTRQTLVMFDNAGSYGLNNTALNAFYILNRKPLIPLKRSLAKLYGRALTAKDIDFAICQFNELKSDTLNYYLNVQEMDYAGHLLLNQGHRKEGLETLKLLTLIDPANSFPYYSYGLGLEQIEKNNEAVMMYRKAIAVNANDKYAITALERLLKKL
ncbi:serine hydrolase domain-containing protein [Pedobacter metabolipauper]|uniref:CubicO group peptidase (Beta-lactamase class C family) n=1 Tax=Pedobacter metabolipauper TaxID=425513 RepID=A0A4R6SYW1_9SPHI|nr:serine hydrolase domain-containing protein [Pedobacter metabolipauper]TDQ11247.1 CubicO group peptidase (beta-lactamase class C family) [Pedobacter metabolipauper]